MRQARLERARSLARGRFAFRVVLGVGARGDFDEFDRCRREFAVAFVAHCEREQGSTRPLLRAARWES
jgi:hypothetical protein